MNDSGTAQEPGCPESVARAVYRALVSGIKLPPLNDSEELRTALLSFEVHSLTPETENSDIINGNKSGDSKGEDRGEDRPQWSSGETRSSKPGPSKEDGPKRKPPASSVLMLEAMSRRRMDAVRQLHEVCPQLLTTIPLFDHRSSVDPGSPNILGAAEVDVFQSQSSSVPLICNRSTTVSRSVSASSSFTLTANTCQLHCSSRLLDLAAENQTLLVFVLQHHPEVSKQPQHPKGGAGGTNEATKPAGARAKISKKCDAYDSINSAHDSCQYHADAPLAQPAVVTSDSGAQKTDEAEKSEGSEFLPGGSKSKEDVEKKDREEDPEGLNPNNPITICIRKNNLEVLQYLLFKHVWQHFLLDELYNLPHTSIVTDALMGELIHACPDCPWFVHCAALTGCPQLLELVLSGHFCTHSLFSSPDLSFSFGERRTSKQDEECARSGMQTVLEDPELRETLLSTHTPDVSMSVPSSTPSSSVCVQNTGSSASQTQKAKISGASDIKSPVDKQNVTRASLTAFSPEVSVSTPPSTPATSASGQTLGSSCLRPKKKVSVSGALPEPHRASLPRRQSASVTVPDPNKLFSVSLPIMDRWISRCMHVRLAALHLACWHCDPVSLKVLLNHGADVRLLAEELPSPDTAQSTPGSQTVTDTASAQSSSLELSLNFMSVTVNTSSLDLSTKCNSMEELLKRGGPECPSGGLSPLALLALGIRSPPDFSLSIGKSLGLVLPTLPELWGGQVDRSCQQSRQLLTEALELLLEAGSDVNASTQVFGKVYRVMELFLQPSLDLYYAPLMPRGGRDSAVLRCMDLERVAEVVLSVCWKLCMRGGQLGPCFSSSMEWDLFRMDWMFLQNEALQRRFLHLAIFLGLFPPLDPRLYIGGDQVGVHAYYFHNHRRKCSAMEKAATTTASAALAVAVAGHVGGSSSLSGEESQSSVGHTAGGTDLRDAHLPSITTPRSPQMFPYDSLPPRPSCVPWAPSALTRMSGSPTSTLTFSPAESEGGGEEEWEGGGVTPTTTFQGAAARVIPPQRPHDLEEVVTSYYSTVASQAGPAQTATSTLAGGRVLRNGRPDADAGPSQVVTPPISPAHFDCSAPPTATAVFRTRNQSSSSPCLPTTTSTIRNTTMTQQPETEGTAPRRCEHSDKAACPGGGGAGGGGGGGSIPSNPPVTRIQRLVWGLEERQRRCLEKFAKDTVRLNMSPGSLALLLRFLCLGDVHLLSRVTQRMLRTSNASTDAPVRRLHEAVSQAQIRTLRHACKLATLQALRWRPPAVQRLPLPDSLKRYLLDSY